MTAPAKPRFRDSAVLVTLRGHGDSLEVYWVRRSDAVAYMPGFEAFVGGTVDADDADLPVEGEPDETERVYKACAIREGFEETGLLVALASPVDPAPLAEARRRLLAGETTFTALARGHGWRFRGDALTFAGRWQTPPFAPVRFDTAFYIVRAPLDQEARVIPGELASGEWVRPREALERYRRGGASFAAPVLHTLEALAEGEAGAAARLTGAPARVAQPVRRIELNWGIVLHPMKTLPLPPATHTNAYLVGERGMALVDPGSDDPAELEALFTLIELLGAEGRKLEMVLLTHHHPDHVAGVEAVRERYGVPVSAHAETGQHVRLDHALADGETIAIDPAAGGWSLRALHTPGHTRGHLCFLHEPTRSLLTGDHVPGGRGTVVVDPPEGDMAAYLRSLERLLDEPASTLFPGHGAPQGAAHRRIRALIAHRLERERRVLDALGDAPAGLAALLEVAYADTPRDLWRWAERSLLAHLVKLEGEGRATREGERWRRRREPGAA